MEKMYWTMWTRNPEGLQEYFPEATFVRFDRIQSGVAVFLLETSDPQMVHTVRRATTQLMAANLLLHCSRGSVPPGSLACTHEADEMVHHYAMDEWVVTDDRLHRVVNYFKADRCDVMWKYAEVDVMTFDNEQAVRAEVQRRIAQYQAQDVAGLL
jgi:hypothetical protein